MEPARREHFQKHFEPWVLAVIFGKISTESPDAAAFLRSHNGETPPTTEAGQLWLEYWCGKAPSAQKLTEVYLKRAIASQCPGTAYEAMVHAYRLADLCGAYLARCWLREQNLTPMRINSMWRCPDMHRWDVNGRY